MKISSYNLNNNLNNLVWYSASIAALASDESTVVSHIQTLPALSVKYVGTDDYYAIRIDYDESEIWLYSGSSLPTDVATEPAGVIKISWIGKTPLSVVSEINNKAGWKAVSLSDLNILREQELFLYVRSGDEWTYSTAWTSFGSTELDAEKSFDGSFIIRASRYMLLYDKRSAIEVLDPGRVSLYAPWYFRIIPGTFRMTNDNGTHLYSIYEHIVDGNWSRISGRPYRYISHSIPLEVDGNRIKVQHTNIRNPVVYIGGERYYGIKRIFSNHGVIELDRKLGMTDDVSVGYEYRDDYYVYRGLNINPLYSDIEDKYIVMYLTPRVTYTTSGATYYTETVHHSLGDTLDEAYSGITGDNPVILSVVKFNTPRGYSFLDLRSPGGGALDIEGLERIQPESAMYNDISWIGGKPYPGYGSILVRVPNDVSVEKDKLDRVIAAGEVAIFDYYKETLTQEDLLHQYLAILEKDCPDTLHVWMPRFDSKRTSSATYDLVSEVALNLQNGAEFSEDGKYVVMEANEYIITPTAVTTRPYAYCALLTRNTAPNTTWRYPVGWNKESLEYRYNTDGASYWEYVLRYSTDGSHVTYSAKVGFADDSYGWVLIECVVNANEKIMRSPKESYHVDDAAGAALYSYTGSLSSWLGGAAVGNAEVAAFIYGGATTSAPLEDLAERVKSGETGRLLSNLFADLIG